MQNVIHQALYSILYTVYVILYTIDISIWFNSGENEKLVSDFFVYRFSMILFWWRRFFFEIFFRLSHDILFRNGVDESVSPVKLAPPVGFVLTAGVGTGTGWEFRPILNPGMGIQISIPGWDRDPGRISKFFYIQNDVFIHCKPNFI